MQILWVFSVENSTYCELKQNKNAETSKNIKQHKIKKKEQKKQPINRKNIILFIKSIQFCSCYFVW